MLLLQLSKRLDSLKASEVSSWPCDIQVLICSNGASGQREAEESSLQPVNLRQSSGGRKCSVGKEQCWEGKPAENTHALQGVMTPCPKTHTVSNMHRVTYIAACDHRCIHTFLCVTDFVWQQCPLLSSSLSLCPFCALSLSENNSVQTS